jgi:sugar fermentation stimulation protein A
MKQPGAADLRWPPLVAGRLIRRYKRFLADVALDDGSAIVAHCPNTGSMQGCSEPGRRVYLSRHDNPRRKLAFTWELIEMPHSLVGVNTLVPNRLVRRAARRQCLEELAGYDRILPEITVDRRTRIDLLLSKPGRRDCYVEIKNCTWVEAATARFPDAVTIRGRKHLLALSRLARQGHRAMIFFLVQRMDADCFRPADDLDPAYGRALRQAVASGVEIIARDVHVDLAAIRLNRRLRIEL